VNHVSLESADRLLDRLRATEGAARAAEERCAAAAAAMAAAVAATVDTAAMDLPPADSDNGARPAAVLASALSRSRRLWLCGVLALIAGTLMAAAARVTLFAALAAAERHSAHTAALNASVESWEGEEVNRQSVLPLHMQAFLDDAAGACEAELLVVRAETARVQSRRDMLERDYNSALEAMSVFIEFLRHAPASAAGDGATNATAREGMGGDDRDDEAECAVAARPGLEALGGLALRVALGPP